MRPISTLFPLRLAALMAATLMAATLLPVAEATGQHFQVGLGALPGAGVQAGYIDDQSWYTAEGMLYADASPGFFTGNGNIQASLGIGGSIRVFGVARFVTGAEYAYDIDVGLRFGPSLYFAREGTPEALNPFRLFVEPFGRYVTRSGSRSHFFAEAGLQRSFLRVGIWLEM
jgi:hypothetical protein